MDVGEDTARGDGDGAEQLAELLVVADCQLDVAGDDAVLLVVTGSVASKLKDLSSEILEDGSQVDGSTCRIELEMRKGKSQQGGM